MTFPYAGCYKHTTLSRPVLSDNESIEVCYLCNSTSLGLVGQVKVSQLRLANQSFDVLVGPRHPRDQNLPSKHSPTPCMSQHVVWKSQEHEMGSPVAPLKPFVFLFLAVKVEIHMTVLCHP